MEVKENILELIGNTPLIKLNKLNKGLKPQIFAKLESANPGGSVKDRIGIAMLDDAIQKGKIKPGGTVVEATSGNTGISFSALGRTLGHNVTIFMPNWLSQERINLIKSFRV